MNLTMQSAAVAAAVRDHLRTDGYGSQGGGATNPTSPPDHQGSTLTNNNVLSPNNQQVLNNVALANLYNHQQSNHVQAQRSQSTGSSGSGERVTPGGNTHSTPQIHQSHQRHSSGDASGPLSPNITGISPCSAAAVSAAAAAAAVGMGGPFSNMAMAGGLQGPSTSMSGIGGIGMGMGGQHPSLMYGMNMTGFPLRHGPPAHMAMQRKYQCKLCTEQFDSKAELQLHTQYHMREAKPYKCTHCPKHFANSSYLSQHMRIHLGIKPFGPCAHCGRKFTQLSHLQQHLRTHTGEKPYRCKFPNCEKAFSQLSNLQSHSRCHQTDKPFKCNSCYKCFSDEQSLLDHIPKHKDSKHLKVHICRLCGKSYTQGTYLAKHMTKHADRRDTARLRDLMHDDHQVAGSNMWSRNGMSDQQNQLFASMHQHHNTDEAALAQLPFNSFSSHGGGMQVSQPCTYTPPAIGGISAGPGTTDPSAFTRLGLAFSRQATLNAAAAAGPSGSRPPYFYDGYKFPPNHAGAQLNSLIRLDQIRDYNQTGVPTHQQTFGDILKRDSVF